MTGGRASRREPSPYPAIAPVAAGADRPFWSVMIPNYNRDALLAATLESVLDQAAPPDEMQIEVVDDASTTGDPESVVRDVGGDRVSFFRQPHNVGAPENFTTCIRRATGRWVHILHSDDVVLPGFYDVYGRHARAQPCVMVTGQSILVNGAGAYFGVSRPLPSANGLLVDAHGLLARFNPVPFPAIVVARSAYEAVGGFHPRLVHAADWEMWTRVAATGPVAYVDTPHTLYRQHEGSDTTRLTRSTRYLSDTLDGLDVILDSCDDPVTRREVRAAAHEILSGRALDASAAQLAAGRRLASIANAAWAVRLHPRLRTIALATRSLGRPRG